MKHWLRDQLKYINWTAIGLIAVAMVVAFFVNVRYVDVLDRYLGDPVVEAFTVHAQEERSLNAHFISFRSTDEANAWLKKNPNVRIYQWEVDVAYAMIPATYTTALERREVYIITVFYAK